MKMEEVAQQYAAEHGLEFHERLRAPQRAPQLAANTALVPHGEVAYAVVGPIAGGRPGMLYMCTGGRAMGPAEAQFEVPGLSGALGGLWVRRSGRSLWTRIKLPAGYTELRFEDEAFDGNYRVAVREASSEAAARRLRDREFTAWHVEHAMQGNKLSQAGVSSWRVTACSCAAPTASATAMASRLLETPPRASRIALQRSSREASSLKRKSRLLSSAPSMHVGGDRRTIGRHRVARFGISPRPPIAPSLASTSEETLPGLTGGAASGRPSSRPPG
jgi:hypothetical protein